MQIVRVYAGEDGESHFEDLTPDQLTALLPRIGGGPIRLSPLPPDSFHDFRPVHHLQIVVVLSGAVEYVATDGGKRVLVPGDVLVAEDLTGRGHLMRNRSETRFALNLPLLPD